MRRAVAGGAGGRHPRPRPVTGAPPAAHSGTPISRCVPHSNSPRRCRIGGRRSAPSADRPPHSDTQKATTRHEIRSTGRSRAPSSRPPPSGAAMSIALLVRRRAGLGPRSRRRRRRRAGQHRRADLPGARRIRNRRSDNTVQRCAAERGIGQRRGHARLDGPPRPRRRCGTVSSVTWTAAPSVGISPDQFALFRISVTLPNQPSVSFPATQTYSDGHGRPLGPAAAARRRRTRIPGADADAVRDRGARCTHGRTARRPTRRRRRRRSRSPQAPAVRRRHRPLAGRRRADRRRGGRRGRRSSGGADVIRRVAVTVVGRRDCSAVLALAGAGTASAHATRIAADPAPGRGARPGARHGSARRSTSSCRPASRP